MTDADTDETGQAPESLDPGDMDFLGTGAAMRRALGRRPRLWTPRPVITVSQYAEARRVLPPGTPFPGPWSNARTPYLVEPMDNMSPQSPVQRTVIAKGAQLGFTAAAENVVAYWMDANPAEILFVSATEELLRKWVTKRLEPTIDSCGFRRVISPQNEVQQRRRTGDRVFSKEYPGGTLDMASAQAAPSLRADSKRVLIRDEVDGAPANLRSGEGNWLDVSFARTNAWGVRRKVLDFSTPTTYDESAIWPEYLAGDCRQYHVPCPHCHRPQVLHWDGGEKSAGGKGGGLKWRTEGPGGKPQMGGRGRLVEAVWYECAHCRERIFNYHKATMLPRGDWQATAVSESEHLRSYHLSSLYSPVGMLSWDEIVERYFRAEKQGADGMRSFVNLYLGEPFREVGQRPAVDRVIELRTGYAAGTIPSDSVLFLTMGVDVQLGSERDREANPPRLELEVCGHGAGYRTWSIDYMRIEGEVRDPHEGAWAEMTRLATEGRFTFRRADGREFQPVLTLVDAGVLINVVYQFVAGWRNTYASKGIDALKRKKDRRLDDDGTEDELSSRNFDRYRVTRQKDGTPLVSVSTNYYKHMVYDSLRKPYKDGATVQAPGFSAFPQSYTLAYFEMLTAEERRQDGSFWCPSGRRNEALDVRVLNLAARDFWLDAKIDSLREHYRKRGATQAQLLEIRSPAVLEIMAQEVAGKIPAVAASS